MYNSQIKTFILVADRGSLSKAAEDLFVTPASIMKQMNALEDRLNLKLLKRTNQGIELTDAGRYIYDSAKKIISESENAVQKARAIEQQSTKTIRIGSSFLNPGKVLLDLWNKVAPSSTEYRFKIIPYDDYHDQILSVVQSLGSKIDFMVGSFSSKQMLNISDFYKLGYYRLCVAVPKNHRFASKTKLSLKDMHGEHLITVKGGDAIQLDEFLKKLKMTHPQIIFDETHYFYDIETFNTCEVTGSLLLTLDTWADIHPSLITLPVEWDFSVPYGLLFSRKLSDEAASFLNDIKSLLSTNE